LKNNQYSKSLPYLQKVAKNNSNNATTAYILGLLYILLDNYDEAVISLEHSIKIDPLYIDSYILLGEIYYNRQDFAKASVIYEKLAELKKDDSNIYCWWGISLLKMGKTDSAMPLFNKAIEIDSTNIEAYYCIGYTYLENGRADEAYKIFRYVEKMK
jgi:tetratricopeptide (TPR) repeat protein